MTQNTLLRAVVQEKRFASEIAVSTEHSRDLEHILGSIFRSYLTPGHLLGQLSEHESFCLYYLLSTHVIDIRGQATVGPLSIPEIARLLAALAGEYPQSLLREQHVKQIDELPHEVRCRYWEHYLSSLAAEDPALSYHDRHVMLRLRLMIDRDPRIASILLID